MWNRKELKGKAKASFQGNYWKCVLISLLFILVGGGALIHPAAAASSGSTTDEEKVLQKQYGIDEQDVVMEILRDGGDSTEEEAGLHVENEYLEGHPVAAAVYITVFITVLVIVTFIVLLLAVLVSILIGNPVEVGCRRFYRKNLTGPAQVKEALYAFDHGYRNIVKILFFRDLYTILWSLLFLIPGIIKSYEYQMIPFLLADNPDMTKEQAFAESRRMMSGNKWNAFVLDLSFLGWEILSLFTFGILHVFYVQPYIDATHAALYETLRDHTPAAGNVYMQDGQL